MTNSFPAAGVIWFLATAFAVCPLVGFGSIIPEGPAAWCGPKWDTRDTLELTYNLTLLMAAYVIPLATMVYCYGKIVLIVRKVEFLLRVPKTIMKI